MIKKNETEDTLDVITGIFFVHIYIVTVSFVTYTKLATLLWHLVLLIS